MAISTPSSLRLLSLSSSRGLSVVDSFVSNPLSGGLIWVRMFKACYKVGLSQRLSVALFGCFLVSRSSPSGLIYCTDFVICVGLLSGFGQRTCMYYLSVLTKKGFLDKTAKGQYTLTEKAKQAESGILGKAEECIKLRNEVLANYSK